MTREDVHRPSTMDPADYRYAGCFYAPTGGDEGDPGDFEMEWSLFPEVEHGDVDSLPWASVRHHSITYSLDGERFVGTYSGGCDHCGNQNVRHFVFFRHEPTGELVSVGFQCADRLSLDSRPALAARERSERAATREKGAAWMAADERRREVVEFLKGQLEDATGPGMPFYVFEPNGSKVLHTIRDEFYASVLRRFLTKGELSEKQVDAVLRSRERNAEREAEREATAEKMNDPEPAPVVEGRIVVEGRLLSTKVVENDFGGTVKMLVLDDRGFKVWATCPSAIIDGAFEQGIREERGGVEQGVKQFLAAGMKCRVRFTATVERSRDDETFGFGKRPTKAQVI